MTTNGISIETPLIYSNPLSVFTSREVYLKLECTQPSGSFKLRGISASCIEKVNNGCKKLVGSSGGNAGIALAYSASKLGVPCQLFVPTTCVPRMIDRIKAYGIEVTVSGDNWAEANKQALEAAQDPDVGYIHPFDDDAVRAALSGIITSIKEQLEGKKPSGIIVSVGGGGLLGGILLGLEAVGWEDVPVVTVETEGANNFHLSVQAGKIVAKPPNTIAKSLGSTCVAPILMEWLPKFKIITQVISDAESANGCVRFADDHSMLIEPACGATLALIYSKLVPKVLDDNGYDSTAGPIVAIVCGGSDVTAQMLLDFEKEYGL